MEPWAAHLLIGYQARYDVVTVAGSMAICIPKNRLPKHSNRPALVDYFPPAEDQGGWRSLLPENGDPDQKQKAAIREFAGVNWDKLQEAWRYNEAADGPTGLLVIRRGQVVGEWYKDCDRKSDFNIYSCSKAYTSTAFGMILTDWGAAAEPGIKPLSLDTKVCNAQWIPEALPLSDARKSEITVRHLLNMVSGLGDENPPDPPGGKSPFEPKEKPFEWFLGHVEASPMAKLKTDPGKAFHYSNAGVAHLVLLFHRATGSDLYPFMKERVLSPIGVRQIRWIANGGDGAIGPFSQGYSGVTTTGANTPVSATCHCTAVSGPASSWSRLDITISPGPRSPRSPITAHSGGSTPTTRTRPAISSSVRAFATTTDSSSQVSTWCLSGLDVAISTPRTSTPSS